MREHCAQGVYVSVHTCLHMTKQAMGAGCTMACVSIWSICLQVYMACGGCK
jgi:hypothetical protein